MTSIKRDIIHFNIFGNLSISPENDDLIQAYIDEESKQSYLWMYFKSPHFVHLKKLGKSVIEKYCLAIEKAKKISIESDDKIQLELFLEYLKKIQFLTFFKIKDLSNLMETNLLNSETNLLNNEFKEKSILFFRNCQSIHNQMTIIAFTDVCIIHT